MKQAFLYTLKVWLTTIGIAYIVMLALIFYKLSKPDHTRELDPVFGTIVFLIVNVLFLPAWVGFAFGIMPITKRRLAVRKQQALLSGLAFILLACIVAPLSIVIYPDVSYDGIGLFYLICMIVSIWIHKPPLLSKIASHPNNENN